MTNRPNQNSITLDCPLVVHNGGNPAPANGAEYSLGAWMAPPVGASGRRGVCNPCVLGILKGNITAYQYNEATGQVTQI